MNQINRMLWEKDTRKSGLPRKTIQDDLALYPKKQYGASHIREPGELGAPTKKQPPYSGRVA